MTANSLSPSHGTPLIFILAHTAYSAHFRPPSRESYKKSEGNCAFSRTAAIVSKSTTTHFYHFQWYNFPTLCIVISFQHICAAYHFFFSMEVSQLCCTKESHFCFVLAHNIRSQYLTDTTPSIIIHRHATIS